MEPLKIVASCLDGRRLRGTTHSFGPDKPSFFLLPAGLYGTQHCIELALADLKAVFFVQSFEGNPQYNERKEFEAGDRVAGRKATVDFVDGEQIVGTVMDYNDKTVGFFLFPVDPKSNNRKVFIINASVNGVHLE